MNKVILTGRLTAKPEIRSTKEGTPIATFSLAVDRVKEGVDFLPVIVWNKQAETCEKYLDKGSKIFLEGRIQTRSYEGKNGKVNLTEIIAENVEFLTPKKATKEEMRKVARHMENINDRAVMFYEKLPNATKMA